MLLKNKKGVTLIELLMAITIVGIVSPILFIIFISGVQDYTTTSKYLDEQYSVMEVTRLIRQDVEEARTVTFHRDASKITKVEFAFPDDKAGSPEVGTPRKSKTWYFDKYTNSSGEEHRGLFLQIADETATMLVDDLDEKSEFAVKPISNKPEEITSLILVIKPAQLNTKMYNGRNVNENINTEFSVRYKNKAYK